MGAVARGIVVIVVFFLFYLFLLLWHFFVLRLNDTRAEASFLCLDISTGLEDVHIPRDVKPLGVGRYLEGSLGKRAVPTDTHTHIHVDARTTY